MLQQEDTYFNRYYSKNHNRSTNEIYNRIKRILKLVLLCLCITITGFLECMNMYIKYMVIEYLKLTKYYWICYFIVLDSFIKFWQSLLYIQYMYTNNRLFKEKNY